MSMSDSIVLDIRDLKSHFFTAKGEIPAVDGVSICLLYTSVTALIFEFPSVQKMCTPVSKI